MKKHKWAVVYLLVIGLVAIGYLFRSVWVSDARPVYEVINFSGNVEVFRHQEGAWKKINRGDWINTRDRVRTQDRSDIDFKASDKAIFRLKENSEIEATGSGFQSDHGTSAQGPELKGGVLLAYILKEWEGGQVSIPTPVFQLRALSGSAFRLELAKEGDSEKAYLSVLRGEAFAKSKLISQKSEIPVKTMEQIEVIPAQEIKKAKSISQREWYRINEGYELMERTLPAEQLQADLSKEAGSLFDSVIDHGTFYTPKIGYANREFIKDPDTGNVRLFFEYDVFPTGSYVGVYILTRNVDGSQYDNISFDVRRNPQDDGYPAKFKIEIKGKEGIVKSIVVDNIKKDWRMVNVPLRFENPLEITEVTFVFINNQVGEHKKGSLEFRNLGLNPK